MKSCPECTATYPDDYAICPKDGAPLHETAMWQIGTVVRGKYLIQARLGEGGMVCLHAETIPPSPPRMPRLSTRLPCGRSGRSSVENTSFRRVWAKAGW